MKIRKMLKYPPYYYIALINILSKDYEQGFKEANKIGTYLKNNLEEETIILGPAMASVFRINNIWNLCDNRNICQWFSNGIYGRIYY